MNNIGVLSHQIQYNSSLCLRNYQNKRKYYHISMLLFLWNHFLEILMLLKKLFLCIVTKKRMKISAQGNIQYQIVDKVVERAMFASQNNHC